VEKEWKMKYFETITGNFIEVSRRDLERASRSELVDYLESRGSACYDNESTELLREAALEDFDGEYFEGAVSNR
tara:strand:- start:1784 stop:2005 length:222 start_codon:yes stop_codon:yes gene_type:complete